MIMGQTDVFILLSLLMSLSQALVPSQESDFTNFEKQSILDYHNKIRGEVASGKGLGNQPSAKYMPPLLWSNELAKTAQTWADICDTYNAHDSQEKRNANTGFTFVGQNVQFCSLTWDNCTDWGMKQFYDEALNYTLGSNSCTDTETKCLHYTQLVWAKTRVVGCGFKKSCPSGRFYGKFVCNYGPGGNTIGELPYASGLTASECPSEAPFRKNGLCLTINDVISDPTAKCSVSSYLCSRNGGQFDDSKCSCKCSGDQVLANCQKNCTDTLDSDYCQSCRNAGYCGGDYANIMASSCAKTCNYCEPSLNGITFNSALKVNAGV